MIEKFYRSGNDESCVIYGYTPPPDGRYILNDEKYFTGEDYRSVERYKEYKEAGFNTLLSQMTALYSGEEWESSDAKKVMDVAYAAGIDKIILLDKKIMELSRVVGGIVGEGKEFCSEYELDELIALRMKDYSKHTAFYGVQIVDEPSKDQFLSIGQIFHSIKRVCPKAFVQCNLLPLSPFRMTCNRFPQGIDIFDKFEKYIEAFLDATGADYFMYDCYPFEETPKYMPLYIRGLQISANIAKKRGCKFYFVAQSFSMKMNGIMQHIKPTTVDLSWQTNMLLAHGVGQFGYYTYWSKIGYLDNDEYYDYDSGIMTADGKKTTAYYDVKRENEKIQKLFPVLSQFRFNKTTFAAGSFRSYPCYENYIFSENNLRIKSMITDKEQILLNEFVNEKENLHLYALVNATPSNFVYPDGEEQCSTIVFDDDYDCADVFISDWKTIEIKDKTLSINLKIGEAAYILPYKKEKKDE